MIVTVATDVLEPTRRLMTSAHTYMHDSFLTLLHPFRGMDNLMDEECVSYIPMPSTGCHGNIQFSVLRFEN